jgi:hypothetical protein
MRLRLTVALLLLVAHVTIPLIALSTASDPNRDNPEFYFTRLRYRENGMRNRRFRGTMAKPAPYHCPEFGGGNFFPPQG